MKTESREYYAARARDERDAAGKAKSPEARQAHEEMAQAYAQLAEQAPSTEGQPDGERPAV